MTESNLKLNLICHSILSICTLMEKKSFLLPSIVLSLAFMIGCYILGTKWVQSKANNNRYVTVKGLSERDVIADKAWWSINSQNGANTIDDIQLRVTYVETKVKSFLQKYGFTEDEITIESINIYTNNYQDAKYRYNADIQISVTTDDISKVTLAQKSVTDLISQGILVQAEKWASGPKYYFTKFKDVKTEMLAEATKEAKKAAEEFANNSGSNVGLIRRANQGVFQILPGNKTQEDQVFFPHKNIRVVSTVDYFLE